ncbi:unnamed protein product [Rhizopus stolonifer]
MSNKFNLIHSLTCIACSDILIDPITLSCGYTICAHCFPISSPSSIKKSVFKCPAPHCDAATHLFGPELSQDVTITHLTQTLRQSLTCTNQNPATEAQSFLPLLNCTACQNPAVDPTTTPCGHTFCRLCLLQSKIETDGCKVCTRPLPKFASLMSQPSNQVLSRLVKELQCAGCLPYNTRETPLLDSFQLHQTNVPLFVSGKVILPGQQARIPIHTPAQFEQFSRALIPSTRYNGLCLVSVHRSHPHVAQFGTILQIVNAEQHNNSLLLQVVGVDRFRINEFDTLADFDILQEPSLSLISMDVSHDYTMELADSILQCIQYLSQPSNTKVLHAQTAGLLGPLWLESMTSLHGPIPSKESPAAVCWWVASTLPVNENDLYVLLRTLSLVDRLELVISWLQAYQSQWTSCRARAIHAYLQVPQTL